ncbi:nuclear transport factor 2 family protein [Reichenbachiella ulvae]|uniref:Nuclear transport factor 2 family protein n=1 Tax=Reichenbachiella ulvae TaxID=2980104 RepID=A0ABT3CQF4_9BACT|nr:nuclear transport factor 2 family protein [Reichenbachiella ulvae]MCV9385887.1 nuclear transport factor 2 family protein [Reichenbachiella ulvae]
MRRTLTFLLFCVSPLMGLAQEERINELLDAWHQAASEANADSYFDLLADDGYFLGTDSSEVWTKEEFYGFSKPYFDKGKAWSFKATRRKVFFSSNEKVAWFEETLDTWMGPCRGSGVLEKEKGEWKLKQYNLAVLVANDDIQEYLKILKGKSADE